MMTRNITTQKDIWQMPRKIYDLRKGEFVARIHSNSHHKFAFCHLFDEYGERVMTRDGVAAAVAALHRDQIKDAGWRAKICKGAEFIVTLGRVGAESTFDYFVTEIVKDV